MKPPERINHSQGRYPRPQVRKQSSTSLTSIFSSFTNTSGGSSTSTTTVTQESMSQTRTRSSKHTAPSKSGSKRGNLPTSSSTQVAKVQDLNLAHSAIPNVFEFLDAEQSSTNLIESLDVPLQTPTSPTHATDLVVSDNAQKEILNTSFYSDSGISIPDSTSEHEERAEDGKPSNSQLKPKIQDCTSYVKRRVRPSANRVRPRHDESQETVDEDLEDLPFPEAYYLREGQAGQMIPPVAPQPPSNLKTEIEEVSDISESESGYDFLASKLSSSDIPPVYRRFAKLNHRLLLHLQDEIMEMEQELEYLDDAETECRAVDARANGRPIPPASRRIIPRSPRHNAVFFRRLDVLGRLSMKVEQYNHSLCSFQKANESLGRHSASENDVNAYRTWMDKHLAISPLETKFLYHDDDLVSIGRNSFLLNADSSTAHFLITVIATAIVLPLLAFSAIPQFFGRIIVLGIVGAAVTLFLGCSRVAGLLTPEEIWRCGAIYFLVMTLAAIMVS